MPRRLPIPDEERTLQNNILEYAKLRHVLAHHTPAVAVAVDRTADNPPGRRRYITPTVGDVGYFDLTLIGPGGIILAELKRRRGAKHPEAQKAWKAAAEQAAAHFDRNRFIVVKWTFANWPDGIRAAIDVIAKPSPYLIVESGVPAVIHINDNRPPPVTPGMRAALRAEIERRHRGLNT